LGRRAGIEESEHAMDIDPSRDEPKTETET